MAKYVLLNNIEHKDIRINTERSAQFGDNIRYAPTFLKEFRQAQAYYPIFFQKDSSTEQFMPVTLFGFENDENLFLDEGKWDAPYIPLSMQRMPFYIGTQKIERDGLTEQERVITLDIESPRVSEDEGAALFLEFGGNSDYLENMANILETLHLGLQENDEFLHMLQTFGLLESVTLDIELNDGSKNQLLGFYTINEDALNSLAVENIVELQQNDYLQAIYMIIASQSHIRDLITKKNNLL